MKVMLIKSLLLVGILACVLSTVSAVEENHHDDTKAVDDIEDQEDTEDEEWGVARFFNLQHPKSKSKSKSKSNKHNRNKGRKCEDFDDGDDEDENKRGRFAGWKDRLRSGRWCRGRGRFRSAQCWKNSCGKCGECHSQRWRKCHCYRGWRGRDCGEVDTETPVPEPTTTPEPPTFPPITPVPPTPVPPTPVPPTPVPTTPVPTTPAPTTDVPPTPVPTTPVPPTRVPTTAVPPTPAPTPVPPGSTAVPPTPAPPTPVPPTPSPPTPAPPTPAPPTPVPPTPVPPTPVPTTPVPPTPAPTPVPPGSTAVPPTPAPPTPAPPTPEPPTPVPTTTPLPPGSTFAPPTPVPPTPVPPTTTAVPPTPVPPTPAPPSPVPATTTTPAPPTPTPAPPTPEPPGATTPAPVPAEEINCALDYSCGNTTNETLVVPLKPINARTGLAVNESALDGVLNTTFEVEENVNSFVVESRAQYFATRPMRFVGDWASDVATFLIDAINLVIQLFSGEVAILTEYTIIIERRDLLSGWTLASNFQADVDALPGYYSGNEDAFASFLDKWGTHIVVSATYGARLRHEGEKADCDSIHRRANEETDIMNEFASEGGKASPYITGVAGGPSQEILNEVGVEQWRLMVNASNYVALDVDVVPIYNETIIVDANKRDALMEAEADRKPWEWPDISTLTCWIDEVKVGVIVGAVVGSVVGAVFLGASGYLGFTKWMASKGGTGQTGSSTLDEPTSVVPAPDSGVTGGGRSNAYSGGGV